MLNKLLDYWWYYVINLKRYEKKLIKYQGFGDKSIIDFKRNNNLDWKIVKIILENFLIIDGLELRNSLRTFVANHQELISNPNTFITNFGPTEKSGTFILNQFTHCFPLLYYKVYDNKELHKLPQDSNIIFLDDFIGTGDQALRYIRPITNAIGNSVKPFLFTLCSTNSGLNKIEQAKTKFTVFSALILNKEEYFLLDDNCNKLTFNQKKKLTKINTLLGDNSEFNLNIPFAFYYTIPDNSLPLLWLDGAKYINDQGFEKEWYGLTPRSY